MDHEFLLPDTSAAISKDDGHGSHGERSSHKEPDSQRMTNADFRKMMMTPRADKNMTAMAALALGAGNSSLGGTTPRTGNAASRYVSINIWRKYVKYCYCVFGKDINTHYMTALL